MEKLTLDLSNVKSFVSEEEYKSVKKEVFNSFDTLISQKGEGNDFLGWLNLPQDYDKDEFNRILAAAKKIRSNSKILLSVGIGGSYLGAKCAVELFKKYFNGDDFEVIFVGNQISSTYLAQLLDYIKDKDYSINVISKSGTTTEPAIAFRILRKALIEKYGVLEAKNRIFATTDKVKGALKTLASNEGYETFVVPDNIGGRFSVLTAVGLLPIACAGIDIKKMIDGANNMRKILLNKTDDNLAIQYATIRNALYNKGYDVELLVNYEPRLNYFAEWWKQLFGESEGKDHKGIYPSSVSFSTDLHSLGQMIQDGKRHFFETVINVVKPEIDLEIPFDEENLDGLNFLKGHTMDYVNKQAMEGTAIAHKDGGTPNMRINIDSICEETFGQMIYFFEFACALSAYTLKVNPFNQPGVESYKKNMFALLDKPGYSDLRKELLAKLNK